MKSVLFFLALTLSLSSFAQDRVIVNSKKINIRASEAFIIRNSQSPDSVTLTFQVPMAKSVCDEWGTRSVLRTSGFDCGYDQILSGYRNIPICIRRNPFNNACVNERIDRVPYYSSFPRTCYVNENYCAKPGVDTAYEADEIVIKFKDLADLDDAQEEKFLVTAQQKRLDNGNVVYDVVVIEAFGEYEVKSKGLFGSDKYVIQPK